MSIKKQLLAASVLTTVTLAVGLTPADGEKYPVAFSGGQRQRIGIARAIVGQPKFIVADEPISALDVSIQAQVLSLMMALREQQALTYLFISHDLSQVQAISDRVAVLYFGHLVELGSTTAIFDNPVHPYTQELLAAIPPIGKPLIAKQRQIITVGTTWTEVTPGNFVRQYPRQS
ncbi:ATP-binding cassette domain-containing protein [Weissella cibaria]|uniref:ABC transporter ATP-binding protein n=1 Tax=Weissella cibaria TaxID=137591 RepID=UPI003CC8B967